MSYRVRERLVDGGRSVQLLAAVTAISLFVAPFLLGPRWTSILISGMLFAVFATAFNLLYGYTGLLSFGHAMFVAIAAYTAAKVYRFIGPALGIPELFGGVSVVVTFVVALVLSVLTATLLAVLVGYFSVQLEEIYFAMITLSFSMAFFVILHQDISGQVAEAVEEAFPALDGIATLLFTNGSDGLTIPYDAMGRIDVFGLQVTFMNISNYYVYYFVVLLFFAASMYVLWRIVQSPFGDVCKAIRENPGRARALGIDVTRHSWATFVVTGAFAGLMGALYAPFVASVLPGTAHWTFSAFPVIMTVIGGPYSFLGPTVGAFVYQIVRWSIDQVPVLAARWQFVFGTIIVVVILFFDNGVAGGLERLWQWLGVAAERYREDGIRGVASFTWRTIASWIRGVWNVVVGWIRGVWNVVVGWIRRARKAVGG